MTLYRVANDSKVVEALINAAENGKEVVALVELRARFDEENNIEWCRRLEDAGCHVVLYGLDGLEGSFQSLPDHQKKTGRSDLSTSPRFGTGNYDEKTARLYTDLLSADSAPGDRRRST